MSNQHREAQAAVAFNAIMDQLAAMSNQHREAQAAAAFNAERAHTQVTDLEDRLKASVAAEREA